MTYNDVYKKFMIEYDKADISSSYPSLTIYEIATLLDKAYLALITQKVTGNNPRQSVLDSDIKASSDIQGLITTVKGIDFVKGLYENELECDLRKDYLYLIRCYVKRIGKTNYDQIALVIPSIYAEKFRTTSYNKPWLKQMVCFLENNTLHLLFDSDDIDNFGDANIHPEVDAVVVVQPIKFSDKNTNGDLYIKTDTIMDIPDTTCEELINLAIIFACKNVENPRLSSELQTKTLEA